MDTHHILSDHPYIKELDELDAQYMDRAEFHKHAGNVLKKMGSDNEFLKAVIRRNFTDDGYLAQEWSLFNIPFFYVYETDHFVIKVHIFPEDKHKRQGIAAHAIHHHNNYHLTTYAFFGSGYETLLFGKNVHPDESTKHTEMKISRHFHQKDWNPSMVESWEPHIVFIPESLSATILMWSPDKKRSTDKFRNNPVLKYFKTPLRKLIHMLGLTNSVGIASAKTYQFYPHESGKHFMAIEEGEYFAPTKQAKGKEVDEYSAQMIFSFIQSAGLVEVDFWESVKDNSRIPAYYKPFINKLISGEKIPVVYHRDEINIPQKTYTIKDIYKSAGQEMPNSN